MQLAAPSFALAARPDLLEDALYSGDDLSFAGRPEHKIHGAQPEGLDDIPLPPPWQTGR